MARRGGRPGDYLMTDEYYGTTRFASELKRDYWGAYAAKPLKRNLQEICSPLNDPIPVYPCNGSEYEVVNSAITTVAPTKVGVTNKNTNRDNPAIQGGVVT